MDNFKKNIFKTISIDNPVIPLDPFDYMIVTYSYRFDDFLRDLDSATTFQGTGTIEDTKFVGCGQNSGYITPDNTRNINNAYLYQAGDDVSNGKGESIVINFKSMETDAITTNDDVQVELYAGWCLHGTQLSGDITNVSITTYLGGTMSIVGNVITSTGTIVSPSPFNRNDIPVISGCCGTNPLTGKTHIGTVFYNFTTKVASVTFY